MSSTEQCLLVVGIDFGTTYSGYAYSFNYEYALDPLKINVNKLTRTSHGANFYKVPTAILFHRSRTDDQSVYFGNEAEETYADLVIEKESHNWLLFRQFKMNLYYVKNLSRETMLESACGVHHKALDVFSKSIGYFKRHLMESVKNEVATITMDDINWVITVPAIWNDAAKQFMTEAAVEAGIKKNHLMLALEPEAASLYCRILPVDRNEDASNQINASQPGTKYMTLDIGGGTVDVTVHQIESDGRLTEIHKASGGAWGGTRVDENFIKKLHQYCGQQTYEEFATEHPADRVELQHYFELAKRRTTNVLEGEWINIHIPYELKCKWNRSIEHSEYKWAGDKIRMKREVFEKLFESSIQSIINHLYELFKALQNLNIMFLVGGFSECRILQDAVKREFQQRVAAIRVPRDAGSAVMLGAVLYGHDQSMIWKRISRSTYGVGVWTDFDPKIHSPGKKCVVEGKEWCKDTFDTFLKANHTYECGQEIHKVFHPLKSDQKEVSIPVYISQNVEVKYVTDPNCKMIGCLRLEMPDTTLGKNRPIDVTFRVGGTNLQVFAIDRQHAETVQAQFDFLSHN